MSFNPATDYLGLWRNIAGTISKVEMPGLDYVVAAMARAGLITLSVSATAPVVNQSTTAWLQAAVPSYSAEGALSLWDPTTGTYAPATAALLLDMLQATAGQNGVSWWTAAGGPPLNTVGNNGDFAIRTDGPRGIYGPKSAGAWPASPIPGTVDTLSSATLDNTFGSVEGQLIVRGPAVWQPLAIGAEKTILTPIGSLPTWEALSVLLDAVFGVTQGSLLYRDVAAWGSLPPGVANEVLATGGPGANPVWQPRTLEFPPGTTMLFKQTTAPLGWTKQVVLNDYGLRVTSGAVGVTPGTPFSTVFAQTAVGAHALTVAEMPPHSHVIPLQIAGKAVTDVVGNNTITADNTNTSVVGGGAPHTHPISLALAYIDVIIASKD